MKRVALAITTYQRNDLLLPLVRHILTLQAAYKGHNTYQLCVADSDKNNLIHEILVPLGVKYSVNQGNDFDDNVLSFWQNHAASYDYVFCIGDDDQLAAGPNPLYLIDAAIDLGAEAVLFNHREFTADAQGRADLGVLFYPDFLLPFDSKRFLHAVLRRPARYIGLLYSARFIERHLDTIALFRGTLHLYAAPLVLACLHGSFAFFDYPACWFSMRDKNDGAWSRYDLVFHGLIKLLGLYKQILPPELYLVAETGFFHHYFSEKAELRGWVQDQELIPSEQEIRIVLAGIPAGGLGGSPSQDGNESHARQHHP